MGNFATAQPICGTFMGPPNIHVHYKGRDYRGGGIPSPPKKERKITTSSSAFCCAAACAYQPRATSSNKWVLLLLVNKWDKGFLPLSGPLLLHVLFYSSSTPCVLRQKRHPLLSNTNSSSSPVSFILTFYRVISCVTPFSFFLFPLFIYPFHFFSSSSFISLTHSPTLPLQH